jgi:hypothetical protein
MDINNQIATFISTQTPTKQVDLLLLNELLLQLMPGAKRTFFDGLNADGKVVANPTIGYGEGTLNYADGSSKETFRIGVSANKTGISIYLIGLNDHDYLAKHFGSIIGKASVKAYCIRFKTLKDIHLDVLRETLLYGVNSN